MVDILLVEDESIIRAALRRFLERNRFQVEEAGSVPEALERLQRNSFKLIISDLRLPGAPGTDLISLAGAIPVLIMTSYASLRSAVDAMKMGAIDYIAKPFDHDDMLAAVKRILREQSAANDLDQGLPADGPDGMIGTSSAMKQVFSRIKKVAPTTATVLIRGETGTGKELVARAIHHGSARAEQPLISVNCAAIPETLIESELFGYEKGAFTGAASNRIGLIEAADGGTLFLDEIGELPLEAQARLLRFIQEGEIRAIGSVQTRKVDVRLITATHRDLKSLSAKGDFRQDLFYRINVVELVLPPLRERGADILAIARALLKSTSERINVPELHFSADAEAAITGYDWPGNVRELENAVERAAILSDDMAISADLLPQATSRPSAARTVTPDEDVSGNSSALDNGEELSLEEYFQRFVLQNQDHMSETELARKLGVSPKCLWERRQRFGIPRKKSSEEDADAGSSASA